MHEITFVYDICHVDFMRWYKYLFAMHAFRFFLIISMLGNLVTLWFHNSHGLLHGNVWHGIGIAIIGYGLLLQGMRRDRIAYLAMASSLLALVLQHGYLDLRFQSSMSSSQESIWSIYLYVFTPILFIAWYAKRSHVIAYIFISALADLALGASLQPHFDLHFSEAVKATVWRTLAFLVIGISLMHLLGRLRLANQAIRNQSLARAQLAESRERNRIARELHDTLAHSLSALAIQLEAIDATWDADPARNRLRVRESLQTTRNGLTETRLAIQNLKSHPIESLGLAGAIRQCAEQASLRGVFTLNDSIENLAKEPSANVCHSFFRVAQEALENVVRHSNANEVKVELVQRDSELILRIIDNGIGVQKKELQNGRFGIQGMQERAEIIHAKFEIHSKSGEGCAVELRWGGE